MSKKRAHRTRTCAGGLVGGNRRMRRAIARGAIRRQPLKRGMLVAPKDSWPRFDGGISMEIAGSTDEGLPVFGYRHSLAYQARMRLPLSCCFSRTSTQTTMLAHSAAPPACNLAKEWPLRDVHVGLPHASMSVGPFDHTGCAAPL